MRHPWVKITDDNWPTKNRYLFVETKECLMLAHTNSTQDIIYDVYMTKNNSEMGDALNPVAYQYITKTVYETIFHNSEIFEKFNNKLSK